MILLKLNDLVRLLREELQQYGEMLARLEEQQEFVMRRVADDLLQSVARVQDQGKVIMEARRQREISQNEVARSLHLPDEAKFADLLPLLPDDYRPLVGALVEENNALLRRIHHLARQNHLLLSRSLELMQKFINTLIPSLGTAVYGQNGTMFLPALPARPLLEAVG